LKNPIKWLRGLVPGLRTLFRLRQAENELDEEITYHLDRQVDEDIRRGLTPAEARYAALRSIGNVERIKEECRDMRKTNFVVDLIQDVRYSFRSLRKSPRFTIVAVLTVVLGVGANATIFSVLNPLLFKPLPYPEPDRIVNLYRTSQSSQSWGHSVPNYFTHRERNTVFEELAAVTWEDVSLAEAGEPAEGLFGMRATASFFSMLGVKPALGRVFAESEDQAGTEPVVILSYTLWRNRFGGDASILGRRLRLDGRSTTVVGIMPENFEYPLFWGAVDLWRPHAFTAQQRQNRGHSYLRSFGRLKPGVSIEQADSSMKAIASQIAAE